MQWSQRDLQCPLSDHPVIALHSACAQIRGGSSPTESEIIIDHISLWLAISLLQAVSGRRFPLCFDCDILQRARHKVVSTECLCQAALLGLITPMLTASAAFWSMPDRVIHVVLVQQDYLTSGCCVFAYSHPRELTASRWPRYFVPKSSPELRPNETHHYQTRHQRVQLLVRYVVLATLLCQVTELAQ